VQNICAQGSVTFTGWLKVMLRFESTGTFVASAAGVVLETKVMSTAAAGDTPRTSVATSTIAAHAAARKQATFTDGTFLSTCLPRC
jgi:hypothetical protein